MPEQPLSIAPGLLAAAGAYIIGVFILGYGLPSQMPLGIPIHHVFLFLGLMGALRFFHLTPLPVFLLPLLLFSAALIRWTFGDGGFFALRDLSACVDVLWLIVGYTAGVARSGTSLLTRWPVICAWAVGYWLLYPLNPFLWDIAPFWGLHENGFFGYMRPEIYIPILIGAVLLWNDSLPRRLVVWLLAGCVVVGLLTMGRLCLLTSSFALLWLGSHGYIRMSIAVTAIVTVTALFYVMPLIDVPIETRYGNLRGHLLLQAIQSTYDGGNLEGATGGLAQRFGWWMDGIDKTLQVDGGVLWGRGYGMVLTDHRVGDVVTRELHNSWVSMFCRLGLLGLGLLVCLALFVTQRLLAGAEGRLRLLLPIAFLAFGLFICLEPGLENPDSASVIWFVAGLGMALMDQRQATGRTQAEGRRL